MISLRVLTDFLILGTQIWQEELSRGEVER